MSVFYKLVENKIPGSKARGKWYARAKSMGTKTTDDIAEMIVNNSSATRGDVLAVLSEFADAVGQCLMDGYRVKIDHLGSFKVGVRSKGALSPKDFDDGNHLCKPVIHFTPDAVYQPELRQYSTRALKGIKYTNVTKLAMGKKKKPKK